MIEFERTVKNGKITTYIDVCLPDLMCPCCGKPMSHLEHTEMEGHGVGQTYMEFFCSACGLTFKGCKDYYHYKDLSDFYEFVKSRIELRR